MGQTILRQPLIYLGRPPSVCGEKRNPYNVQAVSSLQREMQSAQRAEGTKISEREPAEH